MSFRQTYFQEEWLNEAEFKNIIIPNLKDRSSAICLICNKKVIRLSNMGKRALKSHLSGKEHIKKKNINDLNFDINLFSSVKSKPPITSVSIDL